MRRGPRRPGSTRTWQNPRASAASSRPSSRRSTAGCRATPARGSCLLGVLFELRIAWRYLYTGRKNNALLAALGVVLGVAALTTVLAVTTGFQQQFRDKVLGVNAHVIVMSSEGTFAEYRYVMKVAAGVGPDVLAVQPLAHMHISAPPR